MTCGEGPKRRWGGTPVARRPIPKAEALPTGYR